MFGSTGDGIIYVQSCKICIHKRLLCWVFFISNSGTERAEAASQIICESEWRFIHLGRFSRFSYSSAPPDILEGCWVLEGSKSLVQLDGTSNFPLKRMRAITHLLSEHAGPRLTFFIAVFLRPSL